MRIAFLCKRQYMRKDVIVDRYARLYELPRQLALKGHEVLGLCLSYRSCDECDEEHKAGSGRLRWRGLAPGDLSPLGVIRYPWRASKLVREFWPQILIGSSDAPHIVLAGWLAARLGIPYAIDLYDNFESFGLSRLPGLRRLYREVIRRASVVSCVSEPLARLVRTEYRALGNVFALPSTVDCSMFFSRDRQQCRQELGLPPNRRLVGTAGGLQADKGITCVYRAYERLAANNPDVDLVLAGGLDRTCPPPSGPRVHYLGELSHSQVATLFGALDVGVVFLQDTPYGRYSFPQKAYEMLACGLPIVAARVGAMEDLLKDFPQALYAADDSEHLAAKMELQLKNPLCPLVQIDDWAGLASKLEAVLLGL